MNPSIANSRSKGFTLVEVLIALVLLTLIMSLLFGALHLATKSWRAGAAHNNKIEEKRLVGEYLRTQLSQIVPLIWTDPRGGKVIFEGEEDRIRFVGSLPINRKTGKLSLLEMFVEEKDGGKQLSLAYQDLSPDRSPFDEFDDDIGQTLVLDQIEEVSFQYFGRMKASTQPPEWFDKWDSRNLLPMLIKCQITLSDGEQWPALSIPMMVDNVRGLRQFVLQASASNSRRSNANNSETSTDDADGSLAE